ncbi:hypothetical protein M0R45_006670 [Rubus argutus]|uniref:Uncharacterized protein n=1 Tax=Rubus argutus TaxID=59490 RepID=A0AAW1YR83_RUBAR
MPCPKLFLIVLINHREELLPLIMCAIERHPDSSTRDSLTHTLFNLIKRPDEQQRRIIMDACVSLAENVGEMRTETELLPPMLGANKSYLIEDSATVVREAAVHNLALLLPLFPNMDKYFKVEELMFQLVCDLLWSGGGNHTQRIAPLSAVLLFLGLKGSVESHLRVLGERERWNVDVLLRMLLEMLPSVHQKRLRCAYILLILKQLEQYFLHPFLELYAGGHIQLPAFEWLHIDCFPDLIQLACLLPPKEDTLRNRITTRFLLARWGRCSSDIFSHLQAIPKSKVWRQGRLWLRDWLLCAYYLFSWLSTNCNAEIVDAVRFLCTFEVHHGMIFNILWEMVVSSNIDMKVSAANLLKVIVPYIECKSGPSYSYCACLVTLGLCQN